MDDSGEYGGSQEDDMAQDNREDTTVEEQENAVTSDLLPDEQEFLRLFRAVWDPGGNRKEDQSGFHHPVTRIVSSTSGHSESREPISGEMYSLFSDQGRNFDGKLFQAVCEALDIHKTRTTPYRPSANGQVERYNRTLMEAVRCYIGKNQITWDKSIQQIAGALRASVNKSIDFTANVLMLTTRKSTCPD
ncbi:uncharacterized protein LOC127844660 [Dreissena polymorpha]|uniref:uncharacterized protein LOC127844660 n=1 Tax=Dreissena polymorpha TaxID=45954 RepID=UPI002264C1A5|nr:uncharacterized protein LOC127844660 [Dreissena polymorpha]